MYLLSVIISLIFLCICKLSLGMGGLIWDKQSQKFISIFDVSTFNELWTEIIQISRSKEIQKLNGLELKLAYYEEKNIINFYDNDTKITGVCGEMWNIISEVVDLRVVPYKFNELNFGYKLGNGTYTGLMGLMQQKKIDVIPRAAFFLSNSDVLDYIVPMWRISFRVYTPPEFKSNESWLFTMFSFRVWLSLITLLILFGILGNTMEKIRRRNKYDLTSTLHDHLFYTYAVLCSQGFSASLDNRSKILAITKRLFTWMFMISLSSHLMSFMTTKSLDPPFDSIETLVNSTNYKLVVFKGSITYEKFRLKYGSIYEYTKDRNRIIYADTPDAMYKKTCYDKKGKYAMLEASDRQRASGRSICPIVETGHPYFITWATAGITKGLTYRRSLDIAMLRMLEFGLIDGLVDRWFIPAHLLWDTSSYDSINLKEVHILFAILIIAAMVSIIICAFENICFMYQRHQKRTKWTKHLRKQAKQIRQNFKNSEFIR